MEKIEAADNAVEQKQVEKYWRPVLRQSGNIPRKTNIWKGR
ncbi:MAG: hypothetical protein ACK5KN_00660 [Dysgonomonas sp.]